MTIDCWWTRARFAHTLIPEWVTWKHSVPKFLFAHGDHTWLTRGNRHFHVWDKISMQRFCLHALKAQISLVEFKPMSTRWSIVLQVTKKTLHMCFECGFHRNMKNCTTFTISAFICSSPTGSQHRKSTGIQQSSQRNDPILHSTPSYGLIIILGSILWKKGVCFTWIQITCQHQGRLSEFVFSVGIEALLQKKPDAVQLVVDQRLEGRKVCYRSTELSLWKAQVL